jgi:hypothetical protein
MFSFYHRYPILIFFLIHHFIMKTSHKSDELKKKKGGPQIGYLWLLQFLSVPSQGHCGFQFSGC